jgi:hypothetical protein
MDHHHHIIIHGFHTRTHIPNESTRKRHSKDTREDRERDRERERERGRERDRDRESGEERERERGKEMTEAHGLKVEGVGVVKNVAREDDEAVVPVGDHRRGPATLQIITTTN